MSFRGELLRLARHARRMTQKELADRLGVKQPYVSMIEDGLREPSNEQLSRMTAVLGFPEEFFSQSDPVLGTGVGEVFHRKRKTLSKKDLDAVHAWKNVLTFAISRLIEPVDWPEVSLPLAETDLDDDSIERAAELLRAHWYVPPGPIQSVASLLRDAGILVLPIYSMPQKIDAIGQWTAPLPPMIFLNPNMPQDRQRLTVMHEIAHLSLHQHSPVFLDDSIEDQANRFAAAFLMPRSEIRPQLKGLDVKRLSRLKLHWRTSMSSLLMRARHLGQISPSEEKRLWLELARNRWKQREPEVLDVTGEDFFGMFNELVALYRTELGYSYSQLAKITNLNPHEVANLFHDRMNPSVEPPRRIISS